MILPRNRFRLAAILRRALTIILVLAASAGSAERVFAQGTRADYERAAALPNLVRNRVFRTAVSPRWDESGDRLCYRVQTGPRQHEFIIVDTRTKTRTFAFDHARMAESLTKALGSPADPNALPIDELSFADAGPDLLLRFGGKSWRYTPETSTLVAQDAAGSDESLVDTSVSLRSGDNGDETAIIFENRSGRRISLVWRDPSGEAHTYGTVEPGGRHEQHTFAGHVWQALDERGRELARARATAAPRTLTVTASLIEPIEPVQTEAPRGPRGNRERPESPSMSPDGVWRAFIRNNNVWIRRVEGGEEFALSEDGRPDNRYQGRVYWSPDSRYLVALQAKPEQRHEVTIVESSPRTQVQPKVHTFQYLKPGDEVAKPRPRLFDVTSRKAIPIDDALFPNPWSLDEARWEPDSGSFTFVYNQRGHQVLRVVSVDSATGAARALIDEVSPTFIDYAHKTFLHWIAERDEAVWMSERDGWNHLWLYDTATGAVKNQITSGEWVVRNVVQVDDEARQVWFYAGGVRPGQDPYYEHLCRVNFDGSGFVVLTEGDGTHRVEFSPDKRFLIDTWSRVDQAPVVELRSACDGASITVLETADASGLDETGWRAPERFVAKGRDGTTDIHGIIIRPSSFDPNAKYPVIEEIYAGPQGAFVPKAWSVDTRKHALAELGFVVVQIDGMGTNWRSKAFHNVCWKNLGDAGFPDRIAWLKAAQATRPWMDLERVGIYGGSAGGQNALRGLLAHGDFYKVGAADCGCHDNRMDKIWWNELWMGWPVGPEYEASSNVEMAAQLSGKLLLIVGELDRNVDPASTMQVVNALIKADKDFDLLIVPGAGHGAGGSPYGRRRMADFFVRHLLGTEPRRDSAE